MAGASVLDVNRLIDGQQLRPATAMFIIVAMLAMASDGYDLASLGYVAPELVKQWHVTPAALVPAFSAGIIGLMVGGPALGVVGDRYGRKPVIVAALSAIALLDLAITRAGRTGDLVVLRFLIGLLLGGVLPNVTALIAEITRRPIRGRVLVLVSLGVPLGIAAPGLIANRLVPTYGWQAILVSGAAAQFMVAAAVALLLPESLKYLAERGDRDARALRLARQLRSDFAIDGDSRFAVAVTADRPRSMRTLFANGLALVTPLLWACQSANQMANFFSLTWLPTPLQAAGASTSSAGATASLFSLGGVAAGILLLLIIDRLGLVPLILMFFIGAPLVAGMTTTWLPPDIHALVIAGAGFCVTGIQSGLTALLGVIYPTSIRSVGSGWTQAAGRLGALGAPLMGGLLLGWHVPVSHLLFAPACLLLVGGAACIMLTATCRRHFGSFRIGEFSVAGTVDAPAALAP